MENTPPASTPIHHLLDKLYELQQRLLHTGGDNGIEILQKYRGFIQSSSSGRACTYAMKCKNLFMSNDFQVVKKIIEDILLLMEQIENGG